MVQAAGCRHGENSFELIHSNFRCNILLFTLLLNPPYIGMTGLQEEGLNQA